MHKGTKRRCYKKLNNLDIPFPKYHFGNPTAAFWKWYFQSPKIPFLKIAFSDFGYDVTKLKTSRLYYFQNLENSIFENPTIAFLK